VHASEAKIKDPVIHKLIDKIKIGDPVFDPDNKFRHGAVVTIKTKAGKSFTGTVYAPKGSGARGIEWTDVDRKYRTLVAMSGLSAQKIEDSLSIIHAFREVQQVSQLTDLLR